MQCVLPTKQRWSRASSGNSKGITETEWRSIPCIVGLPIYAYQTRIQPDRVTDEQTPENCPTGSQDLIPLVPDVVPVWESQKAFKEKMKKKEFDRRHAAWALPELLPGDEVWVPQFKETGGEGCFRSSTTKIISGAHAQQINTKYMRCCKVVIVHVHKHVSLFLQATLS